MKVFADEFASFLRMKLPICGETTQTLISRDVVEEFSVFAFNFLFSGDSPEVDASLAAQAFVIYLGEIGARLVIEDGSSEDFLFVADMTRHSDRALVPLLTHETSIPRLCEAGVKLGYRAASRLEANRALLTIQASVTPVQQLEIWILWKEPATSPPFSSVTIVSEESVGVWTRYLAIGDANSFTNLGAEMYFRMDLARMTFSKPSQ